MRPGGYLRGIVYHIPPRHSPPGVTRAFFRFQSTMLLLFVGANASLGVGLWLTLRWFVWNAPTPVFLLLTLFGLYAASVFIRIRLSARHKRQLRAWRRTIGYRASTRCAYNLTGLEARGTCLECGCSYRIERTLRRWRGFYFATNPGRRPFLTR